MRPGNTGYSGQKSAGISCDGIQQKKGGLNRVITTVIALAASGVQAEYRGPDGSDQWQPRGPGNEAVQVRVDTSCLPNFVTVGAHKVGTHRVVVSRATVGRVGRVVTC